MFFATISYASSFNCSSTKTLRDVLRLDLDKNKNLVAIAEIAQMPFSNGQVVGQFSNVYSKVKIDKAGTQSVWFTDHYTERITLRLNIKLKFAQIEIFDTDEWKVTRSENLKCDFEGYYEH